MIQETLLRIGEAIADLLPFLPDFPGRPYILVAAFVSMSLGILGAAWVVFSVWGKLSDPQDRVRRADDLARKGDYQAAKEIYIAARSMTAAARMAQKLNQPEEAARYALEGGDFSLAGQILVTLGRTVEAAKAFDQASRTLQAAEQWEAAGDLEQALARYQALGNLGKCEQLLTKLGRFAEIGEMYGREFFRTQSVGGTTPTAAQVERQKALALRGGRAYKEAKAFDKAAELFVQAGMILEAGRIFEEAKEYLRASDLYIQAGKSDDAARALIQAGRYELAADLYEELGRVSEIPKLLELAGKKTESKAISARLAVNEGEKEKAAQLFSEAGEFSEAAGLFAEVGQPAKAGEMYEAAGMLIEAAQAFDVAAEPGRAAPLFARAGRHTEAGRCYERAGKPEAAVEQFEAAGKFFEAGCIREAAGQVDAAIALFQRVPAQSSNAWNATHALGRLFWTKGVPNLAAEKFRKICDGVEPTRENLGAFYDFAVFLEGTGELAKAGQLYEKILSIDFHHRDALNRKKGVEARLRSGVAPPAPIRPADPEVSAGMRRVPILGSRYELKRKIGVGAMGSVYQARDHKLGRDVAVKLLAPHLVLRERQTFLREARVVAALSHPNIVAVFDAGEQDDLVYLVMEYVPGPNLAQYITRRKPIPERKICEIGVQIAQALDYAHGQHVVHRDIKSSNLLLASEQLLKVADFGLARVLEGERLQATQSLGSPLYMAPEQIRGEPLDHRVDLYALGVVLYELTTGGAPFTEGEVTYHHVHTEPRAPSELRRDCSPLLELAILKLLQKDPELRYRTASELVEDLQQISISS